MSSWIAAATSYSVSDVPMIPFYIYYSMFGFQRDRRPGLGGRATRGPAASWSAAPPGGPRSTARACSTRTATRHLMSATIPNCVSYDPTFAHEVAVIVQDGLRRMFAEQEDVFYYLTVMNENYQHPGHARGPGGRGPRGHHPRHVPAAGGAGCRRRRTGTPRVQLLGSRHHPARGDRGRRAAGAGLRGGRRRVERAQLHRAGPRRHRRRPLEHAAPGRGAAGQLRRAEPGRAPGRPGGRLDRLHAGLRRPDPALRGPPLPGAGHRRVRPLGLPPQPAPALRGQPALRRAGRARPSWPPRAPCRPRPPRTPSRATTSTPTSPPPRTPEHPPRRRSRKRRST